MSGALTEWVTRVVETVGYLGVALLVALESVFPPIPSEIVLPLAGFVAGQGKASLVGMIVAATAGSLVGAWVLYAIAASIGPARLHRFIERHGKWFRVTMQDVDRAEGWFDRHEAAAVLVCRCVPLVRSLVSIPAGFRRMSLVRFSVYTVLGSLVWNTGLVSAGFVLGDRWEKVGDYMGIVQAVFAIAVAAAVAWFLWRRVVKPRWGFSGRSNRDRAGSRR
jgi:membrane protein DedA with SNARE-associated domain